MSSKIAASPGRPAWSVAARLTAWYAAAAFALVLLATGYLYLTLVEALDQEDDQFLAHKVAEVRAVLDARPGDPTALRAEVQPVRPDREAGRFYVRVTTGGETVETPGMAQLVPPEAFAGPADWSGGWRAADGRTFRLRTAADPGRGYRVQAAMDTSQDRELLEEFRRHLAYALGLSLPAVAAGGYWIARWGLRPIAEVSATARRIRPGRMGERIATAGLPAEVRELAGTVNDMLDRLEAAFDRLGQFSADIAHELRTPVNTLRGEIEVALGRPRTDAEYRAALASGLEESDRLARVIDALLFLARAENPQTEVVAEAIDLGQELDRMRDFFGPSAADGGVYLRVEATPGCRVRGDRQLIQQAVGNLVSNALAHTPPGGTVTLFADRDGDTVTVGVTDTGTGISAEHLPRVFDRFYRADPARSAGPGRTGLGLAIVKAIAELHRGRVAAVSPPGQGATVTLQLPADGG
ncbi:MAG: heavy metal sensor histidine kinase [Gemmataceae bacterium]